MGTTAEKLSYLNETKTKIKNALETPYNVFRDYPAMIKKYIDNQPTKIVTNGICDNAVELPIVSLKSKGNNYQETTQGKNLFDNTLKDYAYYGNLAKTISTGVRLSVSSPITTSDIIFTVYSIMDLSNFVGKTVRMKATYKSNSALTGKYKIGLCDDKAGNRNAKASSSFTGQEISFIVPEIIEEQKYLAIWFYTNAGGTGATGDYVDYTNVIVTIDNEDMTYEPYTGGTPSPNPDYKQDVEVIDGYNKLDFKTMLKNAGEEFTESKGVFTILSRRGLYNKPFKLNLKPNCTYTMYQECLMQETPNLRLEIIKGETYDVVATSWTSKEDLQDRKITFTTDENSNYYIRGNWSTAVEPLIYNQPILVEGTELKPYLPYGSIGLKQSGKNKFDNFKEYSYSNSNLNTTSLNNGIKIEKKGGFGLWVFDNLENLDEKIVRAKSKFNDGGSIAIGLASLNGTSRTIMKENTKSDTVSSFVIPKITDDKKYLAVWLYGSDNSEISYEDLIVTIDNEDMTYEPYHEPKVISINLNGNTLAKVGDVKDILKVNKNGEVEIEKKVGKINLKDITVWYQDKELSNSNRFYTNEIIYANSNLTLSNYFKYSNIQNINTVDEQGLCAANNRQIALRINKTLVTNVNELKQWSLEHDVEVYYQLTTSEVIKLPSINPIELWQGTNIFKLITNLETNFEVEYVVDKDSMLDEVQTVMLNAEIEI